MNTASAKTHRLVQLSLLLALEALMTFTPLGFIPVPPASITIMHIPVIIGGVLLGKGAGALLGGAFGIFSMIRATFAAAGPVDLLFNPAVSGNPLGSIAMAVLPRILLGVVAAWVYLLLKNRAKRPVAVCVAAVCACLVHSFGVLGLLSLLFAAFPLVQVFGLIIGVNGLLELGAGVMLSTAGCSAIFAAQGRRQ